MLNFLLQIYLYSIGISVASAAVYNWYFRRTTKTLPGHWNSSDSIKRFRIGITLLWIYLSNHFVIEYIATSMSDHGICNGYVYAINNTLSVGLFFGFLWIHSITPWKKITYVLLIVGLISVFAIGGFYIPNCDISGYDALIPFSIYFLGALLYLSDLLLQPKTEHFGFQLKVTVVFMIFYILMTISCTAVWIIPVENAEWSLINVFQMITINSFYLILAIIFAVETLKLKRR